MQMQQQDLPSEIHQNEQLSFNAKRGLPCVTARGRTRMFVSAIGFTGADEPVCEWAVIAAVRGLLPIETPPREISTINDPAPRPEVYHRAANDVAHMT